MKERAESFSNCLLSGTPNMTIMVDEELRIVEFNAAAERVFGISRHEAWKILVRTDGFLRLEEVLSPPVYGG
ncbi:MAG: PAS domain-containing protein [Hydrogeniiclostridium mannosilyticum]